MQLEPLSIGHGMTIEVSEKSNEMFETGTTPPAPPPPWDTLPKDKDYRPSSEDNKVAITMTLSLFSLLHLRIATTDTHQPWQESLQVYVEVIMEGHPSELVALTKDSITLTTTTKLQTGTGGLEAWRATLITERVSNMVNVDVEVFRARRRSPCPILH